jgi:hypothetical protein
LITVTRSEFAKAASLVIYAEVKVVGGAGLDEIVGGYSSA